VNVVIVCIPSKTLWKDGVVGIVAMKTKRIGNAKKNIIAIILDQWNVADVKIPKFSVLSAAV
jgi:hypothetical protein